MTPDDPLGDLLREDANAYRPGDGRPAIGQRIRARRRHRVVLRGVVPVAVAVVVAAIVVPVVTFGRSAGPVPATPATGSASSSPARPSGRPAPSSSPAPRPSGHALPTNATASSPATASAPPGLTTERPVSSPRTSATGSGPQPTPRSGSTSMTGATGTTQPTTTSHPASDASRFLGQAVFDPQVIPTAGALYLAWDLSSPPASAPSPPRSVLDRVDAPTGTILAHRAFDGQVSRVLGANGDLWVEIGSAGGAMLDRLDPQTLSIESTTAIPTTGMMAAAGGQLWVAAGDRLVRMSFDGAVIGSVSLSSGAISTVASNAAGTVLIDGEATNGAGALQRRDPRTGALIASYPMQGVTAPIPTTISGGALWVSEPTGMLSYVQRFDAGTLTPVGHAIQGTNAIEARLWDGRIWVTQPDRPANNFCADPATGSRLAAITLPDLEQDEVLAVANGYLYYAAPAPRGGRSFVDREPVPSACGGS